MEQFSFSKNRLAGNPWKIAAYRSLSEFWLIAPILIPYYRANGLNSTQVFTIQAVYALAMLLLEVPSGYLADVIGRRWTMVLGAIFLPLGLTVYTLGHGFLPFVCAETLIAVGNSMRSGCDSALLYDSLLVLQREGEYKQREGQVVFYSRLGTGLSAVIGGLTAAIFLRLPFLLNIAASLGLLPLALTLIEPERLRPRAKRPWREILHISWFSLSQPRLRPWIILSALITACQIIALWAYFFYYTALHFPVASFGFLFAIFQIASAFGSNMAHTLATKFGTKKLFWLVWLFGPFLILMGFFPSPFMVLLILANAFLWGLSTPLLLNAIQQQISSETRATVLSVTSMAGFLLYTLLSPIFGRVVDAFSLALALQLLGGFFFLAALWTIVCVLRHSHNARIM